MDQAENIKIFNEIHEGYKTHNFKPIEYVENNNGCWDVVNRHIRKNGYIKIKRFNKDFLIHRYVYECVNGPIAKGLVVMHKCDRPICINPNHLGLGTQKENLQDMRNKNRDKIPPSKLNKDQVLEIAKLLEKRITHKEIAKKFNVSRENISVIKRRETWSYLTKEFNF